MKTDLEALKLEMESFRSSREKKGPLPRDFWKRASILAQNLGISMVASTLRLNATQLGKMCNKPQRARKASAREEITVVRLTAKAPVVETELSSSLAAEVIGPAGMTIRLHNTCSNDFLRNLLKAWGASK